jgi:hypothetical protein
LESCIKADGLRNVDYLYTAKTDIITVYEDKAVVAINWIDTAEKI